MSRINTIVKALQEKGIESYKVLEVKTNSYEQFYVIQKLETSRVVETLEDEVTVYVETTENGKKYLGDSSFIVSKKASKKELYKLIDDAVYAAKFVKNDFYKLVQGEGKKSVKSKKLNEEPFDVLQKIANIHIECSTKEVKFNSLELFLNQKQSHLVTSNNVDYKKDEFEIKVEAIPSFTSPEFKTELYSMKEYSLVDYEKIKKDALEEVSDTLDRAHAQKLENVSKINVLLKARSSLEMMWEYISPYSLASVYNKTNTHSIGESVQENATCPITLSLKPLNKADYFDADGVLQSERLIIENGVLKEYYGNNRFAYYLKKTPSGRLRRVNLECGKLSEKQLKKQPYIELLELSGIQVDVFANYLGGEVRLAKYFDGKKIIPISGFSFSCELKAAMNTLELSKEKVETKGFVGPKYILIHDAIINE